MIKGESFAYFHWRRRYQRRAFCTIGVGICYLCELEFIALQRRRDPKKVERS